MGKRYESKCLKKINYPRIPVTWKVLKYPALIISLVAVGCCLDLSVWLGLFVGVCISTILISLDVYFRVGRFKRYLVNFGVKAEVVGNNDLAIIGGHFNLKLPHYVAFQELMVLKSIKMKFADLFLGMK